MDDERLAKLEAILTTTESERHHHCKETMLELIAEVRRLQAEVIHYRQGWERVTADTSYTQAYENGIDAAQADIIAILDDPHDPEDVLGEIKGYLGIGSDHA